MVLNLVGSASLISAVQSRTVENREYQYERNPQRNGNPRIGGFDNDVMKSIIIYAVDLLKNSNEHQHYTKLAWTNIGIRSQIVDFGADEALAHAKPLKGEIVLNTIPYED